jgi:hypothetical protein
MFAFTESSVTQSDCPVRSLSWMGRVSNPTDQQQQEQQQQEQQGEDQTIHHNQAQHYSEGWIANGNSQGVVGVTYTSSSSTSNTETDNFKPFRTNFNLRGHRTEVCRNAVEVI